jgi:ligand-binding sensor domain-containing protein
MKRQYFHYLVCLLAFLSYKVMLAQPTNEKVKFSRVEANAELSNSKVNCILQDSKGFLWVGTEDGLNRFDGYEFKVYRNIPEDTT